MKAKHNRMRGAEAGWIGTIPDKATYDAVRFGDSDWKEHIKAKMTAIQIPVDIFYELVRIHNEYEYAIEKAKEENKE